MVKIGFFRLLYHINKENNLKVIIHKQKRADISVLFCFTFNIPI